MINLGVGLPPPPEQGPERLNENHHEAANGVTDPQQSMEKENDDEDELESEANITSVAGNLNVEKVNGGLDHEMNEESDAAEMTERDDGQLLSVVVEEVETRFTANQREELLRVLREVVGQG